MTGGQVAALIFALLLLLPGGCFLVFGIGILAVMGLLFWLAFRKRPPPLGSNTSGP